MDNEALRKQVYEELQPQFEAKLRDIRKQKSQVEEELESSAEKWRSERRRLNSEIDRLESALAESRERRKSSDSKTTTKSVDVVDLAKVQAAADEKLKKAAADWETERTKLQSENARLQQGVAELLERANNPLRAGQAAKEQLQLRLDEAVKAKQHAENLLLEANAVWEKEKLKLTGEIVKARRSAGLKTPKGELPEDEEVTRLKAQLDDARQKITSLEAQAARASALAAKVTELESQLVTIRDGAARQYADLIDQERKETGKARERLEKEIESLKAAQAADLERQAAQIEETRKAHARITELEAQVATIRDAAAREYADQIERERKETNKTREKLEREIELLKGAQAAELDRQTAHVEETQKAYARIKELEHRLQETKAGAAKDLTEKIEKQLREVTDAKQTLERELRTRTEEYRNAKERLAEAESEVQQLERRLDATKDLVSTEAVEQLRRQYDERMQEMIRQKTQLSEQLNSASALLEAERSRFAAAAASPKTAEAPPASGNTIDEEKISAEVARVEGKIEGIARLIDDPSTELSIVIRKNVERAELDAYLKGILFSLGKNSGL